MPFINSNDITTMIYEYNRGDKTVRVDPAIVWRKLNAACRNLGVTFDKLMDQWNDSIVLEEDNESEILAKMVLFSDLEPKIEYITRNAFDIPVINEDGQGGTVALVLRTLSDFLSGAKKKRGYRDLAVFVAHFGWGPPGFIEGVLGVERLTYDVFYGLLLNKHLAIASHSLPVSWGVQATLNGMPSLLMFEAESDFAGEDAGQRMNQMLADRKLQEGVDKFHERFGSRS